MRRKIFRSASELGSIATQLTLLLLALDYVLNNDDDDARHTRHF